MTACSGLRLSCSPPGCSSAAPSGEPSGVPAGPTAADAGADRQSGWEVTVYYTAVESFHDDETVEVRGCLTIDCTNGDDLLGEWPEGFVTAVKDEGTGRITSGEQAGRYLNWASTEGYWLDDAPRDADGGVLVPMRSVPADGVPRAPRCNWSTVDVLQAAVRLRPPCATG